ncbi:unnamed protein product [Aphanomyces euteiches]
MVVTLSPSKANFEETVTTLRFAERLKAVVCQPQPKPVVEVPKEKYTEAQFEALQVWKDVSYEKLIVYDLVASKPTAGNSQTFQSKM